MIPTEVNKENDGKINFLDPKKRITVNLSGKDVDIILQALGYYQRERQDRPQQVKLIGWTIDRFYRAMGVRL